MCGGAAVHLLQQHHLLKLGEQPEDEEGDISKSRANERLEKQLPDSPSEPDQVLYFSVMF